MPFGSHALGAGGNGWMPALSDLPCATNCMPFLNELARTYGPYELVLAEWALPELDYLMLAPWNDRSFLHGPYDIEKAAIGEANHS